MSNEYSFIWEHIKKFLLYIFQGGGNAFKILFCKTTESAYEQNVLIRLHI